MAVKKKAKKKATKKAAPKKKATRKKVTKKVAPKKKTAVKKKATTKAPATGPLKAGVKPRTKNQMITDIASRRGISKKEVIGVFEDIEEIIAIELKKHKKFNLAGLVKMVEKKRPARKARKGINPFTGEETTFKAKPASKTVKAVALKKLKDML